MENAQELYDSGMSLRELTAHLGVSFHTIRKLNLKTRSASEGCIVRAKRHPMPQAQREKMRDHALSRGLGGYRPHPNRGKRYNDIWFDSNWEVQVAISLDENNVRWERPSIGFLWNEKNKYYPDFYLPDFDVYLDPKNDYLIKKDAFKISEASRLNNIKVLLLNKQQLDWKIIKTMLF